MSENSFWDASYVNEDVGSAVKRVMLLAEAAKPMAIRLVNANSISAARSDYRYREVLRSTGLNYADGIPLAAVLTVLAWMNRSTRHRRVRGPSLFEQTLETSQESRISHLFFGGSPETLTSMERALRARYPLLQVAGFVSPPIAEAQELIDLAVMAHKRYGGDVVWLGLGQPKQDLVAQRLAKEISRPCIGVGAAFDFVAGSVRAAPKWMQRTGFEWLFRLFQEPRRLWRRYTVGNVIFLTVCLAEIIRSTRSALETHRYPASEAVSPGRRIKRLSRRALDEDRNSS